ncbi:hypothetical protein GGR52DRAFT_573969 [Hypoxylon sp. FL1284]|nr:hypothetical protein GGR52DRAFT_573969 [Hypoxylon sp. FL1284]
MDAGDNIVSYQPRLVLVEPSNVQDTAPARPGTSASADEVEYDVEGDDGDVMDAWVDRPYLQTQLKESGEGLERAIYAITEMFKKSQGLLDLEWESPPR